MGHRILRPALRPALKLILDVVQLEQKSLISRDLQACRVVGSIVVEV